MRKGYVYFLRAEDGTGPIKIGHSIIPEGRVRTMADWSPIKLTIIHQTEGGAKLERALHRYFAEHRLHGEWFSPAPELLYLIRRLQEGAALCEAPAYHDHHDDQPPSKLSDYLSQSGLSMQAFADEIGLSYEGVRLIVKGQRMPAPKTVFRIEEVTDGAVSRSDLRPDLWPGPKAGEAA